MDNSLPQLTLFDDVVIPQTPTPKKRDESNGKRKTKGWLKQAIPESFQDSLDLEALPLNDEDLVDDYQAIHEKLLFVSLTPCLGDNVSLDHLEEIIEWVLVPIVNPDLQSVDPFTFQACCMSANVDAGDMQDLVFPVIQKALDRALS